MKGIAAFLAAHGPAVSARLTRVRGSSPREEGATVLVAEAAIQGTIGGGQLEYMVIDRARAMLRAGEKRATMDVPLGPEIGQCCGGRVELVLARVDGAEEARLRADAAARRAAEPRVLIFGAGHVGRALARALAPLPLAVTVLDSREAELAQLPDGTRAELTPLPEAALRAAPPGSGYVVLTHDHALDFLLASEALARGDAGYVGMIGSATKRARFVRFHAETTGGDAAALVCPMGAQDGVRDKRPEVIAALVAAELLGALCDKIPARPARAASHAP